MRRTIRPHKRKNIKNQDIVLDILEKNQSLFVQIKIDNLSDYKFPNQAKIYLECFDNLNIDHINLGDIESFKPTQRHLPSFKPLQRSRIKFRLKITSAKTYRLLGLADRLKERKYTESLLPIDMDKNINSIFKIKWDDPDHPTLLVSQKLRECLEGIKPVLVTAVFKEILLTLLLSPEFEEALEDHKWIQFAKKYKPWTDDWISASDAEKREWIDNVLGEFSKKLKTIKKLQKKLERV